MSKRPLLSAKLRASGIHLALSAVAFGIVLYLILVRWYPSPWFGIDGGWQGVRIMLFVDVVLGPFLTLIIFNPAKSPRALAFDFTLIGVTQVCAFVWGVHAVHAKRPVAIVFWNDSFYSVEEKSLIKQGQCLSDLKTFDERTPALIYARPPRNHDEAQTMIAQMFASKLSEYDQCQLYAPLRENLDKVYANSVANSRAIAADAAASSALVRLMKGHPGINAADLRFVRFDGRYNPATLVFTPDGNVLGVLPPVKPAAAARLR